MKRICRELRKEVREYFNYQGGAKVLFLRLVFQNFGDLILAGILQPDGKKAVCLLTYNGYDGNKKLPGSWGVTELDHRWGDDPTELMEYYGCHFEGGYK